MAHGRQSRQSCPRQMPHAASGSMRLLPAQGDHHLLWHLLAPRVGECPYMAAHTSHTSHAVDLPFMLLCCPNMLRRQVPVDSHCLPAVYIYESSERQEGIVPVPTGLRAVQQFGPATGDSPKQTLVLACAGARAA